jgi:RNA-directed DNA polymerase
MLTHLPMGRGTLRKWLKASYVEQDGIISPALYNLTLDGLERALQERFTPTEKIGKRNQVHLVRYADDCAPRTHERGLNHVRMR